MAIKTPSTANQQHDKEGRRTRKASWKANKIPQKSNKKIANEIHHLLVH